MNRLISASAGSGKTYALTTQYLRLLRARHQEVVSGMADSLRVESLLAATFTRKAAGEILDRILMRLAAAALDRDDGLTDLQGAMADKTLTQEACQDLLLHLCRNLHRVQVGTLDSFFQRLCRVYRQEAGLTGDMRMADPKSPRCVALQKQAVEAMLEEMGNLEEAGALFQTLMRQRASSAVVPKILTLLQDVSETAEGAEPHHWEKLQVPIRPAQKEIDAAEVSLRAAMPLFRLKSWRTAVESDLSKFHNGEWEGFYDKGLSHASTKTSPTFGSGADVISDQIIADYAVLREVAKHEMLKELKNRTLAIRDFHAKFSKKFVEARRAEGFVLFSETPTLLSKIIEDVAETAKRLDAPVEHLLLDEFQDTSDPQWGLLKGFAKEAARPPGSVFIVGDAKQAIYGWRGGRAEIFEQIENDIQFKAETLDKSYRSSEVVLNVVNAVFGAVEDNGVFQADDEKSVRHRQTAKRWSAYFGPHRAAKALPGVVELCVSPVPPDPSLTPVAGDLEDAEDDGAGWNAAGASYHLVRSAERMALEISRLPPGISVGVLVRTNKTLAQMTDLLRAQNVVVSSEGIGTIADDPAVELMLSGLLLADHPGHSAAAYHVAHSPLGETFGLRPLEHADAVRTAEAATAVRRRILSEGYAGVLSSWAAVLAPFGMDRTARRLEQILEMAAGFDALPPMRPSEFVRAVRESSTENPGSAPVRVMTINRAKGLEFDAVFLPDLEWKTRASDKTCLVKRSRVADISVGASPIEAIYARPNGTLQKLDPELLAASQAAEAEEVTGMLCLLYVAMTRPRQALHLYVAPHKMTHAGLPHAPGLKPAAILRAAFCGSASHPAQGDEWESLLPVNGRPDWYRAAEGIDEGADKEIVAAPAATVPQARLTPQFKASSGGRRGSLPHTRQDAVKSVRDLLQLRPD